MASENDRYADLVVVIDRAIEATYTNLRAAIRCCPNCTNFAEKSEVCNLAGARPPATVIAFGCEKFDHNIPF